MSEELRYQWVDIPAETYSKDLDDFWAELQKQDSALSKEAKELGIDTAPLQNVNRQDAISVTREGEGFDPATITIIVALAPVATAAIKALTPIIQDVWKHILLPRIVQRRGDQALTPKE